MDKTTKFILGLIAVALIGINVQMWNGKLIKDAQAHDVYHNHISDDIANFATMVYKLVEDCTPTVYGIGYDGTNEINC